MSSKLIYIPKSSLASPTLGYFIVNTWNLKMNLGSPKKNAIVSFCKRNSSVLTNYLPRFRHREGRSSRVESTTEHELYIHRLHPLINGDVVGYTVSWRVYSLQYNMNEVTVLPWQSRVPSTPSPSCCRDRDGPSSLPFPSVI